MRHRLVTAPVLLFATLPAQAGREAPRSQPEWAAQLAKAHATYQRGMNDVRARYELLIAEHVTRLERQGRDREATRLERDGKHMASTGQLPSGLPTTVVPTELMQLERGLRAQHIAAYRQAAEACRKLLDDDLARALEFEAKQRTTENDRNQLRGLELGPREATSGGRGPRGVASEAGTSRSLLARFEQHLSAIDTNPRPLPVHAPGEEFELEVVAKHLSGKGPLCAALQRRGEPALCVESWRSEPGDTVTLRWRWRKESAQIDLADAVPSIRKPSVALAPNHPTLWAVDGKFAILSVRAKAIVPADQIQANAQVAGTATVAGAAAASKPDDPFPPGRTWTARWHDSECSVSVINRDQKTMTLRVMRGDGSIWDFTCTTRGKEFRIGTIVQTKAVGRQVRPLVSDETGSGHVHGDSINFNFKAKTSFPRGAVKSIEGPIQGRQ